jgi:hypothetical protein
MSLNPIFASDAVNAAATAISALLDAGYLRIYSGTQPDSPETEIDDQVLLAELTLGSPAFGDPVDGLLTAEAITAEDSNLADGTATWARLVASDGTTAVADGSVGLSDANVVLDDVDIVTGGTVTVSALTIQVPLHA